jgi:hypothetical protein
MCVFLCANPNVYEWLGKVIARTERQATLLLALCPADPYDSLDDNLRGEVAPEISQTAASDRESVARPRQARTVHRIDATSSHEWHKPLDALANAWSRLLLLVGWRR